MESSSNTLETTKREKHAILKIVRSVLNDFPEGESIEIEDWISIYKTAYENGLTAFLYNYIIHLPNSEQPDPEFVEKIKKAFFIGCGKIVRQTKAIDDIRANCEKNGVDVLFFKGASTRKRYSNPMLRAMGDIDILYKPEQDASVKSTLNDAGFTLYQNLRVHDIFTRNDGVILELHRQLVPSSSPSFGYCEGIWDRVRRSEGYSHVYEMTIEDEIVFNFIHLARHFISGGTGIRFIVDVWIYMHIEADWEYIRNTIERLKLDRFYHIISNIADAWFGSGSIVDQDPAAKEAEDYILSGMTFGSSSNRNNATIAGGRSKAYLNAAFPSYRDMQSMFPWLKHRIQLPYAWIRRWIESIFYRRKNVLSTANKIKNGDEEKAAELKSFFERCGLNI